MRCIVAHDAFLDSSDPTLPPLGDLPTILVVDDEPQLRWLVAAFLTKKGYRVVQAGDGQEALRILHATPVDALICDVVMPKMDGADLANTVWATQPDLPILLMSGHTEDRLGKLRAPLRPASFLPKPFGLKELESAVLDLLTGAK